MRLPQLVRSGAFWLALTFATLLALLVYGLWSAQSRPVERHLNLHVKGWPKGAAPMRLVFASDLHVSDLGRSRARTARVVAQIDALNPDAILLGGDFVGGAVQDHPETIRPALAPLAGLHAPRGVFAVLGNHDHYTEVEEVRAALRAAHIRLLDNLAANAGPIVIGGVDHPSIHRRRLLMESSMARRSGLRVMMAHTPDAAALEAMPIPLALVGHTHCGQVALPVWGAILAATGTPYTCGLYHQGDRILIVSGGIGTSEVPLRLFAPPDLWVIDIGPG